MRILFILLLLQGCSTIDSCYLETGVGAWVEPDGLVNDVPTDLNAYCETGNFSYGWYHTSDITKGRPFNSKEETSTDRIMLHYRVRIK